MMNPTRTRETHTEVNGRTVDKQSVETVGPDGRYVPYANTEKETVRVDSTTVRTIERTFGRGPDGQRILVQESQQESRSLPDGVEKVVRTISSPDANGTLQVVRRELQDSRPTSPGVLNIKTTVLTPDINGGLSPTVQIEERQRQSGAGAIEFKKSTFLSDGSGHWQLGEVTEGTSKKEESGQVVREERVERPDANGKLETVSRTVSKQTENGPAERRDTIETYSINAPGTAPDGSMHLVQRETKIRRNTVAGQQNTRVIERPDPGAISDGLRVTEQAIDIVRPGGTGVAEQKHTILTRDSNGQLGEVWVDVGKTDNPAAIQVDTRTPAKPK